MNVTIQYMKKYAARVQKECIAGTIDDMDQAGYLLPTESEYEY